jgi:hypothetical protein
MEERDGDTAQTAREAIETRRFSDPTLEALRVQRDAYAASGGEAAVIYDKLRDELVVAKQRLSATARGKTWPHQSLVEAELDDKKLDEADQQGAIPAAEPSTVP